MKHLSLIIFIIIISCKQDKLKTDITNVHYEKAKIFRDTKVLDSAFYYYNLAKNDYLKKNDSLGTGKSFVNMAMIQTSNGDFFGGIESSLEATKFLRKEEDSTTRNTLATNYNNIAYAFNFLKNYDKSLQFYFRTLTYVDNDEAKFLCYNNIGDVLITLGKFKLAEKYLEKAILTKNSINYSKALNNLAKAKYLDNKRYNPLPELYKALEIRLKNKDESGLNSSYETLSEYFARKNKKLSLIFAKKMLRVSINTKSSSDQILALKKIIELDPSNYLTNFQKLYSISSTLQTNRNKAKNQFAIIRYDVEKLKTDKAEKEVEVLQRNIGIVALLIILIGGAFYYKKRKQRILLESENRMQEHQLRTSKKVHDVVANGIYQVMTKIENQKEFDKEQALDELEFVYEKSRDISYDDHEVKEDEKYFGEKISTLIASFKNDTVNTYVAGNDDKVWQGLKPSTETEIYQIIREMLVNMKKHSQADRVAFKFERANQEIEIQYSDNGIGMDGNAIFKNGLQNMDSRIEAINGKIIFDTETEKGLKIKISFPVS